MAKQKTETVRVKGRQVRRYYGLLVRLGIDRVFEEATAPRQLPPRGRITSASEQVETPEEAEPAGPVSIDLGLVVRACAGADDSADLSAVDELAAAVLDLDDEAAAAGEWFMDDVERAWPGFSSACGSPMRMLLNSGSGSALGGT